MLPRRVEHCCLLPGVRIVVEAVILVQPRSYADPVHLGLIGGALSLFSPSFLCQPVFALCLWWFLERVSCFSQLQETSAWCISVGSKAQDGVLPFPTGVEEFAYLLIPVTIDVCQCPGRERVCCPFPSGLRSLLHRRKRIWGIAWGFVPVYSSVW